MSINRNSVVSSKTMSAAKAAALDLNNKYKLSSI